MPGISGLAQRIEQQKQSQKIPSMAKGGMVKKTGLHMLHKGEFVMNKKMVDKMKGK